MAQAKAKKKTTRQAPRKTVKNTPRKPARRRKVYTEKHISLFFIGLCLLQTFFLASLLFILIGLRIPNLTTVANYRPLEASIILDARGRIIDRIFTENRSVVSLDRMSPYLPKAFVAAEDGRYYEHQGLDLLSVLRAAINNLREGARSQGGSTITQQVAKSLLLTPEKTYIRKFKEAILAWRIDNLLTKDEILYIYLNQIYLGEGAHGVEAAAQVYFGKSAADLSLGECALLAGLPQAPSRYSLFDHLDRAAERQKYVLNRMAADGYISPRQAKAAYAAKIKLNTARQQANDNNGYYLQAVKKQAREMLGAPLQSSGATVYTYLDTELQYQAMAAVRHGIRGSLGRQVRAERNIEAVPQGALVCLENNTAKVRALVGGTSYSESPFDRATQARRQAGSTFKPFVYATALANGWQPSSAILDSPISISGRSGQWSPKNYGDKYFGTVTLIEALARSLNTATVRLLREVGYREVHRVAKDAGITAKLPPDLSLALGAVDVSLLELTGAYTIFVNQGRYTEPSLIEKIVTTDGRTLYPQTIRERQVISPAIAAQMGTMLKKVVTDGTAKDLRDLPQVGGGKTGTTDEYRDAWFIGYDRRYLTGVWVGNDHNQSMGQQASGGKTAVPIWREFVEAVRR